MTVLLTVAIAVGAFLALVLLLSLKPLLRNRTPLKKHACQVMCRHGHDRVCACDDSAEPGGTQP